MNGTILGIIIIGIALILAGCISSENKLLTEPVIPEIVMQKYNELTEKYKDSLGANVRTCFEPDQPDKEYIFKVSGSGGYSGEEFYFDMQGNDLGIYVWSDVPDPTSSKPPAALKYTECLNLPSKYNLH